MYKVLLIVSVLFLSNCSNINKSRLFEFTYQVDIDSTDGKKIEVWIPIPLTNEVQNISDLVINTNGLNYTIETEKKHNNKYLYINDKRGTTNSTTINIKFNVLRQEHQNVAYNNVSPQNYLESYQTVPVGGVFDEIINKNNLTRQNIRGIYDFVLEGMHYGKPKSVNNQYYKEPWLSPDGKYGSKNVNRDEVVDFYLKAKENKGNYTFGNGNSIYACDIGVGNCTDYHSYFISLERTLGVPSRFHMGFPIPKENSGKVGGYHCWADYYVQGKGWYPVDISEADKAPIKKDYYFGTVDENRVEMMVGRDFELKGYEKELANLFIYPIMEINDIESSNYNKSFTYKNL